VAGRCGCGDEPSELVRFTVSLHNWTFVVVCT
jgi:hypothetical protein